MCEINQALKKGNPSPEDIEIIVGEKYCNFLPLFSETAAQKLPQHSLYSYKILLKKHFMSLFQLLYALSWLDLEELKRWLEENLVKGFVRASSSPRDLPILFIKRAGRGLRLCIYYWPLNRETIKNRYFFLLIVNALLELSQPWIYTNVNFYWAYNGLHIFYGDK